MQKIATREIWTSGITNIPKNDRNARYTFFELDTKDIDKVHFVLDVYRANLGSCYVHELISGYHFYNFRQISKEAYYVIIRKMKHLNPLCPLTVLRIEPNKWENEEKYWKKGAIIGDTDNTVELAEFQINIETQNIKAISEDYEIVRYPFEECPKCGICNTIIWDKSFNCFYCTKCNSQTTGRIKKLGRCYKW